MHIETLESRMLMTAVFTVTNTADSGIGSLRAAITSANNTGIPYSTEILFAIPGKGVRTIKPLSALPTITGQVDIEGATDSKGNPLIELDGESAGDVNGLTFDRNTPGDIRPSVVTGLIINRFQELGISIDGSAPTDVYGCRIGTDSTGKKALANGGGISILNSNNQIGLAGSGPAFLTLISGNTDGGMGIAGNDNIVQNCFIGTDVTGNAPLGNTHAGIEIAGSYNLIGGSRSGEGNVISANIPGLGSGAGIVITNGGQFNEILGNKIGSGANGKTMLGNGLGILLDGGSNNSIGDGRNADANYITGSEGSGISLSDGSNGNQILDNIIGVALNVQIINGNNDAGVQIVNSSYNVINGNLIDANNGDGVLIKQDGSTTTGNSLDKDLIGVDSNGDGLDQFFGNNGNGVNIDGASNTSILECDIENNADAGIEVNGATAVGNSFVGNDVFNNDKLGISIGDNTGVEHPNHDANFNGTGLPNDGINHPVLSSAVVAGDQTVITGTFAAAANTHFDIQVFASSHADHSGFGQGQTFLYQQPFDTDANGIGNFQVNVAAHVAAGQFITAVADVIIDQAGDGDSSEFSNAIRVKGATVSGSVFNDANGNGKKDSGEKPLANQTVFIDSNGNGVFDSDSEVSARTNSSGNFEIFGAPTGSGHLMLQPAKGFVQTSPKPSKPYYKINVTSLANLSGFVFGERKGSATPSLRPAGLGLPSVIAPSGQAGSDADKRTLLDELIGTL